MLNTLKILIIFLGCMIFTYAYSENWQFATIRASDGKQVDIDYDSFRIEDNLIIVTARLPLEKNISNFLSDKLYLHETYAYLCETRKIKWLSQVEENKYGVRKVKFKVDIKNAKYSDIPKGTMLDDVYPLICDKYKELAGIQSASVYAPNGLIIDEWIKITEYKGYPYFAKKESLNKEGDIVWFITGRDNLKSVQDSNGLPYRYELELSFIDCKQSLYSSKDVERFDESGKFVYSIKTKNEPIPTNNELTNTYKNIACDTSDNENKNSDDSSSASSGTAWQVSEKHLITSYHVVKDAKSILVVIADNDIRNAVMVNSDYANDIALIEVEGIKLPSKPLKIRYEQSKLGNRVAVVGFPMPDILGTKTQATTGEISGLMGMNNDPRFFQISASIQSGNSGGPVLNSEGEVIAVVTSKLNDIEVLKSRGEIPQNVNFAIKSNYIKPLLETSGVINTSVLKKSANIEEAIETRKSSVYLIITSN